MPRYSSGAYTPHGALGLILATLLAGCASTGPAPVEDRSVGGPPPRREPAPPKPVASGSYRVQRGDTLYSIAFRHGVDYRDLAEWNGIGAPYTIYAGQDLRTSAPRRAASPAIAATPAAPRASTAARAASPKTSASDIPKPGAFEPLAATPAPAPAAPTPAPAPTATPAKGTPGTTPAPSTPPGAPTVASTAAAAGNAAAAAPKPAPPPAPEPALPAGEVSWRWPADGVVVGTYAAGDPTRQGIDIAGKAGDPVRAAADGAVVYSGNGLIGYGELIIIKHSPSFLSAYGHNRKRLVKEGDRVKAGQVIAEMGSSSASRDSLHFEIRRNGKPANPTDFLPRR
ncbi:peptidoglycan DD-metalloendopeptidase family protein [Dokdonella fugitiva]|uniref:peptidoglycan DD-metalloendopeptidase family protein n=1 Tax=Dokdonella fugitiva TaxID=328517 RepID=UPI0015FA50C8|nr:peptidoglycan DD-metalloendopeptidase family protein [Dokdonella fugitiva]MBA8885247.1 lipoprotein NlpD [Dokdonella fugitiva]